MTTSDVAVTAEGAKRSFPPFIAWWPIWFGPLGMAYSFAAELTGYGDLYEKRGQEVVAILVAAAALLGATIRVIVGRSPVHVILMAVAVCVLCREFHWDWTTKAVYVAIGLIGVWALLWRKRLIPILMANPHVLIWTVCTALTYVLSQFIARRGFRGWLPMEEVIYGSMEEVVENVAHLMLLVTVLLPLKQSAPRAI